MVLESSKYVCGARASPVSMSGDCVVLESSEYTLQLNQSYFLAGYLVMAQSSLQYMKPVV